MDCSSGQDYTYMNLDKLIHLVAIKYVLLWKGETLNLVAAERDYRFFLLLWMWDDLKIQALWESTCKTCRTEIHAVRSMLELALHFILTDDNNKTTTQSLFLQDSRVCTREAFRELAERCTRLGHFKEPVLGHAHSPLGQRRLWGGQTHNSTLTPWLCIIKVLYLTHASDHTILSVM